MQSLLIICLFLLLFSSSTYRGISTRTEGRHCRGTVQLDGYSLQPSDCCFLDQVGNVSAGSNYEYPTAPRRVKVSAPKISSTYVFEFECSRSNSIPFLTLSYCSIYVACLC